MFLGNNFMLQIYSSIIVTIHVHVISCKIFFWDIKQRSRTSYDFPNVSGKHLFVSIPTFDSAKWKQHLTIIPMFSSYILLSFVCKYLICTHISYCCRIAYYFFVHDIIWHLYSLTLYLLFNNFEMFWHNVCVVYNILWVEMTQQ